MGLPTFYHAIQLALILREQGWDVNPESVADLDPYWVQTALLYQEIENDKNLKKARDKVRKSEEKSPSSPEKQSRMQRPQ